MPAPPPPPGFQRAAAAPKAPPPPRGFQRMSQAPERPWVEVEEDPPIGLGDVLMDSLGQTASEWGDVIKGIPRKVSASAASTIAGMQAAELAKLEEASRLIGERRARGEQHWFDPISGMEGTPEEAARIREDMLGELATAREASTDLQPTPGANIGQRALETAAISGLPSGAAVAGGLLTRNPAVAAGIMYPPTVGQSFAGTANQYQDIETQRQAETLSAPQPVDYMKALEFARNEGLIESGTEMLPFSRLLKIGTPGVQRLAEVLLAELPGETLATLMQAINQQLALQPEGEAPLDAVFAGLEEGGRQIPETLVATIIGSAAQTAPFAAAEAFSGREQPQAPPAAPPIDQMLGPQVQGVPALPAPVLEVTPGGVAARPGELEQAGREAADMAAQMGMTPDIVANLQRLQEQEAARPAPELPALPPPDTTLYVDEQGNAQTIGGVEEFLRAVGDAIVAQQGERAELGLTPDVQANIDRLESRKPPPGGSGGAPALPAPDSTIYVDEAGRAGTTAQREDYTRRGNEQARQASDAAAQMGFTADVADAAAQREGGAAVATPAPPAGFVKPEQAPTAIGDQIAPTTGQSQNVTPTSPLQDPNVRSALEAMKSQTGQVQAGGQIVREGQERSGESEGQIGPGGGTGGVVAKTPWAPRAEWWSGRPHALSEAQVKTAIDKALAGKKLSPRQQDLIDYLTTFIAGERRGEEQRRGERRAPPPRTTPERRQAQRRGLGDMSRSELLREITTNPVSGIKNRRAYDEGARQPHQVAIDVDSLKWVNDNMGHEAGDDLLRAVGQALDEQTDHAYHLSGDEFVIEAATPQEAADIMAAVEERLAQATIEVVSPDGDVVTLEGLGISYGQGATLAEADTDLGRSKGTREAQGVRSARGEQPPGATRRAQAAAQGQPAEDNAAADLTDQELDAAATDEDVQLSEEANERPPMADEAARRHGFDPSEIGWNQGRGPLGRGKFMAAARGQSSNLHANADDAVKELAQFIEVSERGAAERTSVDKAQAAIASKLRAGENPSFAEWRKAFPQLREGHRYLRQPDVTPFLVKHFGFSKANIKKPLGRAAGRLRSDSGAEYPIVYFNRLAEVLKGVGSDVLLTEDQGDLFGKNETAQQIADRKRELDKKRSGTRDVAADTGAPGDLFTRSRQADIADQTGDEHLTTVRSKDLEGSIEKLQNRIKRLRPGTPERDGLEETLRPLIDEMQRRSREKPVKSPTTAEDITLTGTGFVSSTRKVEDVEMEERAPQGWERAEPEETDSELVESMRAAVRAMFKGWKNAPEVVFVKTDGLPADLKKRAKFTPKLQWAGIYDPQDNSVHINIDIVRSPTSAQWVAAHEIRGHLGLRGFIGKMGPDARQRVDQALKIAQQNPTIAKLAAALKKQRTALSVLQSVEEALAELQGARATGRWDHIETRYGVKTPEAIKRKVGTALDRFLDRLREILSKFLGAKFTDQQVRELLEGADRYVREGATAPRRERIEPTLAEAHHGSPHKFDKFKLEAVGTGEGAAAYGWGLYFAENPAVADQYANQLSNTTIEELAAGPLVLYKNGRPFDYGIDQSAPIARRLGIKKPTRDDLEAIAYLQEQLFIEEYKVREGFRNDGVRGARLALAGLLEEHTKPDEGAPHRDNVYDLLGNLMDVDNLPITAKITQNKYVYSVEINDDAIETMLEWDAPVGEQPHILKAVNEALGLNEVTVEYWLEVIIDEHENSEAGGTSYSRNYLEGLVEEYVQFSGYGPRGQRVIDELKEAAPERFEEFAMVVERDGLGSISKDDTGEALYKALVSATSSEQRASEKLLAAGVRGIRYYDAGSRDDKKGTSNYVVFDANDITIKTVNGEKVSSAASAKIVENTAEGMDEDAKLSEGKPPDERNVDDILSGGEPLKGNQPPPAPKTLTLRAPSEGKVYGIEVPEKTRRGKVTTVDFNNLGEGPFDTREEAQRFIDAEVGAAGARVREYANEASWRKHAEESDARHYGDDDGGEGDGGEFVDAGPTERRQGQRRAAARDTRGRRKTDKLPSMKGDKGYQALAQRAIDLWNAKVGWRYGAMGKLPGQRAYLEKRYLTLGKVGAAQDIGRGIYESLRTASAADQQAVYAYLTTRDGDSSTIGDPDVRAVAVKTKRAIDAVGQKLVELGMLSQEAYDAHAGEYLPRMYLKHLLGDEATRAIGSGKRVSDLGYLKKRKDIPEEVRKVILGEITDPAFLASFGLSRTLRDIALVEFLQAIAGREQWTPNGATVEWNGKQVSPFWLAEEAKALRRRARLYKPDAMDKALALADEMEVAVDFVLEALGRPDPKEYAQIPNSARYGALRGLWVRKEIYNDLVGAQNLVPAEASIAEALLGQGGALTKATQWWKLSKVVLNPPTQVRNFLSNMMLLHLSGVPARRVFSGEIVGKAINSIAKQDKFYQIAKKYGLFQSTFSNTEGARIREEWLALQDMEGTGIAKLKAFAGRVVNAASDSYAMLEAIGKIAKLRDGMERLGLSPADAMMAAHEALFDYSLVPRSVQYLRNAPLGAPFITFMYKALGQLAKTAVKHPVRFAPYAAVPYLLLELIKNAYDVDDDDIEKLRQAAPSWMRERGSMLLLPYKDSLGRWQMIDMGYLVPWGAFGDLAAAAREGKGAKEALNMLVFGGPVTDVAAAIETNVDPFTGREIVNPADPPQAKLEAMMLYAWNLAMPGFLTQNGAINQYRKALRGDVNTRGEPGATPAQAAMRLFGINLYPVDPEASRAANIRQMEFEQSEMEARASELLRNRNLSDAERDEVRATWRKLLADHAKSIREYQDSSEIHPNLRTK